MTSHKSIETSDIEEISGILEEDRSASRRVTITVYEQNGNYYAVYHLHTRDDQDDAPRPKGYIFHRTEEIFCHDLAFMRRRVKEEADYRGLDHVRNLGF